MGWIGCVRCEKFWCDLMAQTCALIAPVQPILHQVSCSNETLTKAPKHYEMHQTHEFRVQWGGTGAFVAKNSDNTSSHELLHHFGLFSSSLVSQPNGSKCSKILWNAPKHFFRVQWGGSGAFVAKNSVATSWHELLHHYDRFAPSFVTQPNAPQCTKIVRNAPKYEFRVQWYGSCAFVV